jgi:hypothetical protein
MPVQYGKYDMLEIGDWVNWGRLIKTWATGLNYIKGLVYPDDHPEPEKVGKPVPHDGTVPAIHPYDKLPFVNPATKNAEFIAQLEGAQVGAKNAERVKKLDFVPLLNQWHLVIKLPTVEELKTAEKLLEGEQTYNVPAFYQTLIYQGAVLNTNLTLEQKMDVHAARIGDYSISICQ